MDDYLAKWDRFAQGANELVPYLRDNKAKFERELAGLLRAGDRGAPARLVFYAVVQVGGSIDAESELGTAARDVLGSEFPMTVNRDGANVLFCADLYCWWEEHQQEFDRFPRLDDWCARDFARENVLPMYRRLGRRQQ